LFDATAAWKYGLHCMLRSPWTCSWGQLLGAQDRTGTEHMELLSGLAGKAECNQNTRSQQCNLFAASIVA
jgi:hypothetical protein